MAEKKHKATVVVAPREGFGGVYAAGKYWASGQHDGAELNDAEVANLARRPGVIVLIGGKVARAEDSGPATTMVPLTQDEQRAVDQFRAQREQMLKAQTAAGPGFTLEKAGDRSELVDEAMRQSGTNPLLAQAPLQDSRVLHGEPPNTVAGGDATAGTGTVKPISGGDSDTGNVNLAAKMTEGAGAGEKGKKR